jgi:hypothetical protein
LVVALATAATGCGDKGDSKREPLAPARTPATGETARGAARIPGLAASDVAAAAVLAAYPPGKSSPNGWVLLPDDDWHDAVLGAQFAAAPVNAGLLIRKSDYFPPASADLIKRIQPKGFPRGQGLKAIIMGPGKGDILVDLQEQRLRLTQLKGKPAGLAKTLVPFSGGYAHKFSDNVVVISSQDRARDYALPAAAWSAYSGDALAFVDGGKVPKETAELLVQRKKVRLNTPNVYVFGPKSVIPAKVDKELARYGKVQRIGGGNPIEAAIAFAKFKDPKTGFGWGIDKGPASLSLVNLKDWGNAVGAFTFAAAGPQAPLLLTDDSRRLPRQVLDYARSVRDPDQDGQGFVFGDPRSISTDALHKLGGALRKK